MAHLDAAAWMPVVHGLLVVLAGGSWLTVLPMRRKLKLDVEAAAAGAAITTFEHIKQIHEEFFEQQRKLHACEEENRELREAVRRVERKVSVRRRKTRPQRA